MYLTVHIAVDFLKSLIAVVFGGGGGCATGI
jgi:hypothetical protein